MFTALRHDGSSFHLLPRQTKADLKKRRESEEFFCPECKERVILKIGMQKIEHFAHQKSSNCLESYESESEYHLNGKLQLFNQLQKLNLASKLEPYYKSIQQRPDIELYFQQKQYAIEYQCSTISAELMTKRTTKYRKNKCNPLWITGGKNIKRKGQNKVTISSFDGLFLRKNSDGKWYLPAYCSTNQLLILMTNITPLTTRTVLSQFHITPIHNVSLKQLINPTFSSSIKLEDWKKELQSYKSSFLIRRQQSSNEFLQELYQHSLFISLLPPIIGIPVLNSPIIETPPLLWQAYLFIDLIYKRELNEMITFSEVYRCFWNRVKMNQIKLRTLPSVLNSTATAPLIDYLTILARLGILEAINLNTFRIQRIVTIPVNVEKQQWMETQFYKMYGGIFGLL